MVLDYSKYKYKKSWIPFIFHEVNCMNTVTKLWNHSATSKKIAHKCRVWIFFFSSQTQYKYFVLIINKKIMNIPWKARAYHHSWCGGCVVETLDYPLRGRKWEEIKSYFILLVLFCAVNFYCIFCQKLILSWENMPLLITDSNNLMYFTKLVFRKVGITFKKTSLTFLCSSIKKNRCQYQCSSTATALIWGKSGTATIR